MGAGLCSLYCKIHYIDVRYIEVWVYYANLCIALDFSFSPIELKLTLELVLSVNEPPPPPSFLDFFLLLLCKVGNIGSDSQDLLPNFDLGIFGIVGILVVVVLLLLVFEESVDEERKVEDWICWFSWTLGNSWTKLCLVAGLAGRLMPESDFTEKLLTKDLPEEILVMEPDRIDTSILFKEALENKEVWK